MHETECTFEPGLHALDSVFVIYETLVRVYHFFSNAHRLILCDFLRSPHILILGEQKQYKLFLGTSYPRYI